MSDLFTICIERWQLMKSGKWVDNPSNKYDLVGYLNDLSRDNNSGKWDVSIESRKPSCRTCLH